MKILCFLGLGLFMSLGFGCKMSGGSMSETASDSNGPLVCQLNAEQVAQLSSAKELKDAEKVSLESISSEEQDAFGGKSTAKSLCTLEQVSSLGESFPSIASSLSTGAESDTAVAGMGPMGDLGMPGVVRTEYIVVPKAGSRYLAGYNSDGIMVLLLRLIQHRAR
jgi:hypothetical protein